MYLCYKKRDEEAEALFFRLLHSEGIETKVVGGEVDHTVFLLRRSRLGGGGEERRSSEMKV
jgi:hypothetical protein